MTPLTALPMSLSSAWNTQQPMHEFYLLILALLLIHSSLICHLTKLKQTSVNPFSSGIFPF